MPHVSEAMQIDILVGWVTNCLNSFCAALRIVLDKVLCRQHINKVSFIFSAADPGVQHRRGGIYILRDTLSIQSMLQENVHAVCGVLDRVEALTIPLQTASPNIRI